MRLKIRPTSWGFRPCGGFVKFCSKPRLPSSTPAEDHAMPVHFRAGSLFFFVWSFAQAQTTIRADVSLVQLSVRVTDSGGRNVTGLTRDAFRLTVDGEEHPITVFSGEDAPVTAGIIIDNSASMFPK